MMKRTKCLLVISVILFSSNCFSAGVNDFWKKYPEAKKSAKIRSLVQSRVNLEAWKSASMESDDPHKAYSIRTEEIAENGYDYAALAVDMLAKECETVNYHEISKKDCETLISVNTRENGGAENIDGKNPVPAKDPEKLCSALKRMTSGCES